MSSRGADDNRIRHERLSYCAVIEVSVLFSTILPGLERNTVVDTVAARVCVWCEIHYDAVLTGNVVYLQKRTIQWLHSRKYISPAGASGAPSTISSRSGASWRPRPVLQTAVSRTLPTSRSSTAIPALLRRYASSTIRRS